MSAYRLVAEPAVDGDVEAAFDWYENESPGLGLEFLDELRATYGRIAAAPLSYRDLRLGSAELCCDGFRTRFTLPPRS